MANKTITVGGELLRFRTRQGMSQFDLAVCMDWKGTNPVIQIEKDRRLPKPETIERLGQCLNLSYLQIHYLNGLAGYVPPTRLPPPAQVIATLNQLAPVLQRFPYPAYVFDYQFRLWMANPFGYALLQEGNADHTAHVLAMPLNALDTVFDSQFGFYERLDNRPAIQRGQTFRFKATNSFRQHEPFFWSMPERMRFLTARDYEAFRAAWSAIDLLTLPGPGISPSIDVTEFYARMEHGDMRLLFDEGLIAFYMRVESILHLGELFIIVSFLPTVSASYPENRARADAVSQRYAPLGSPDFRVWDVIDVTALYV